MYYKEYNEEYQREGAQGLQYAYRVVPVEAATAAGLNREIQAELIADIRVIQGLYDQGIASLYQFKVGEPMDIVGLGLNHYAILRPVKLLSVLIENN